MQQTTIRLRAATTQLIAAAVPPGAHRGILAALIGSIVVLSVVGALLRPAQSAPQPIVVLATPARTPAPVVQAAAPVEKWVIAWAAPNGDALGPIPAPETFTARWGDGWLATTHDGATVWVRTTDLLDVRAALPDLAPTAAPTIVYVPAAQPAAAPTLPPPTAPALGRPSDKPAPPPKWSTR